MISRRSRIKGIANIPQRRKQANDDNETQTEEAETSNKKVPDEDTVAKKKRKLSETVVSNEEPNKQKQSNSDQSTKTKTTPSQQETPIDKVDQTKIASPNNSIPTTNTDTCFQKPLSITSNAVISDTEYPLPPPSPNKANRTRIKATPRLAHRKMSFSASESEDESRKVARIRTESVSSNIVANDFILPDYISSQRRKEALITPKKTSRSEQTRKLAEARREFVRRFGEKKPERNKLTMMDLIFYNPNSNPMDVAEKNSVDDPEVENPIETHPDDPSPNEEDNGKSDEENSMPVPQIKIGPSGEIILDEQSVLIETKDVQKKREEMNKTKIVDADAMKTGYGIYKKQNRSKCWSESETIRFYKALNSIGTDFTLMSELFPNRTRRELKMKFKKEEKTNRQLIDKAMMQPCRFDFEDLKCELEMEEREMNALRIQNEKQKKEKEENVKKQQHKMLEKAKKRKLVETAETSTEAQTENSEKNEAKQATRGRGRPKKTNKISIKNFMSDSDADESDLGTQSESDEEILLSRKPTRSGRLPKIVQRYENEPASLKSIISGSKVTNPEEMSNIAPGSIMVVNETGPAGEPVYKIYMVTPEQNAKELDLSSDMVTKVLQMKEGITAESIMTISANVTDEEDEFEENNVTIPAEENVTTLKTDSNKKDSNQTNEISKCIQETDTVVETESGKKNYPVLSEDDIVYNVEV
ncbi:unnamed protein product [Phyllotreta striolata]|uniref:Myb-like domain-containing protein n=1 Tax=Phyllotreta striolata TaxID=444603 RepID=A0A9N9XP47_PHYSR|nr:unnamed protein product [Phyllotreta striolata]